MKFTLKFTKMYTKQQVLSKKIHANVCTIPASAVTGAVASEPDTC